MDNDNDNSNSLFSGDNLNNSNSIFGDVNNLNSNIQLHHDDDDEFHSDFSTVSNIHSPNPSAHTNNIFGSPKITPNIFQSNVYVQNTIPNSYSKNPQPEPSSRRIQPKDYSKEKYKGKEVAAVIITINSGGSYDELYQTIEQTPPDPAQYVSVFSLNYPSVKLLLECMQNNNDYSQDFPEVMKEMVEEIAQLEGENIVINFECCAGCGDSGFNGYNAEVFQIIKLSIDRKYICMFSDFSLKSLIGVWDSSLLGPNPFKKVGEFSSNFVLEFDPKKLIDCPFAQLQNVGELCEKGEAISHAMAGTILYTVDDVYRTLDPPYTLTCLTVVSKADGKSYSGATHAITLGEKNGLAGHVMLEYKDGGKILTSCGHWIELVKLDVSMESVIAHATKNFGKEYADNLSVKLQSFSQGEQANELRTISNAYVQKSAPCKYKSVKKF